MGEILLANDGKMYCLKKTANLINKLNTDELIKNFISLIETIKCDNKNITVNVFINEEK